MATAKSAGGRGGADDVPTLAREIATMVVQYVKQETIDPIRGIGRFVALGAAGLVVSGIGILLLVLGGIRLLQDETGSAFRGHLKFLPYVFALVVCAIVAAGALRASAGPSRKDGRGR